MNQYIDNTSTFEYSDEELQFRKDVDIIQQFMPNAWSGCFIPDGSDIDSYNEIYQGSGISVTGADDLYKALDSTILDVFPWVGIYKAFMENQNYKSEDEDIKVISNGINTKILIYGYEVIAKQTIGNLNGLLEVIELNDCGNISDEKTTLCLNRILASYGHNIIVNDSNVNPRYGRSEVDESELSQNDRAPWKIKNQFAKSTEDNMIAWRGNATIEVRMWDDYGPEEVSIKTSLYLGIMDKPLGTMRSYALVPIDEFKEVYKELIHINDIKQLLDYCQSDGRIAPKPEIWNKMFHRFELHEEYIENRYPPRPLVLSAWIYNDDETKKVNFLTHVYWAYKNGLFDYVREYILSIEGENWYRYKYMDITPSSVIGLEASHRYISLDIIKNHFKMWEQTKDEKGFKYDHTKRVL